MHRAGWVSVAVVPDFSWPNVAVEAAYDGRDFLLLPGTVDMACCAAVRSHAGESIIDAGEAVLRLLSAYAWSEDAAIVLLTGVSFAAFSGHTPLREGRARFSASTCGQAAPKASLYLPAPMDPAARLALAMYREGMGVNSYPFALLSFMRVINLKHAKGADQKAWINQSLGKIRGPGANWLADLAGREPDIGKYLYEQGRCAVAHASMTDTVVNPDQLVDTLRMRDDLPLVRALAAHCIEAEFGVLSDLAFRQTHLYDRSQPADMLRLIDGTEGRKRYARS
jgi:hypothetical protein